MNDDTCPMCRGTGKFRGKLAGVSECEVVTAWCGNTITGQCCKPAAYAYPAQGGGYMTLCESHAQPHLGYAKAINMQPVAPRG